jgi:hypothetical protein
MHSECGEKEERRKRLRVLIDSDSDPVTLLHESRETGGRAMDTYHVYNVADPMPSFRLS